MIFLYAYLFLTIMIAARAAWDMIYRLDYFDWRFGDVWSSFFFLVLFWPLLLLKPWILFKVLRSPFAREDNSFIPDLAVRERELYQLRRNPPPCGVNVRFHHQETKEGTGAFLTFPSEAVEQALVAPSDGVCDPDILLWVNRRQDDLDHTDVPEPWWRFKYVAAKLIEHGYGVVQCDACGQRTPGSELRKETASIIGHGFAFWRCNCGEVLLSVETVRIR